MVKMLVPYPENCTGCRFCEMACTDIPRGRDKPRRCAAAGPPEKREVGFPVRVHALHGLWQGMLYASLPGRAIKKKDGVVYVDQEMCTACGACVEVCPFGVMRMEEKAFKCDLCGGDPDLRQVLSDEGDRLRRA